VGHLPMHPPSPGLLTHPAASALAVDQLERGQVVGVVMEEHEAAGVQQGHQLASGRWSGGGQKRKTGLGHGLGWVWAVQGAILWRFALEHPPPTAFVPFPLWFHNKQVLMPWHGRSATA